MKTILVVEDSVVLCRLLSTVLEHEDYRVLTAGNGRIGLNILRQERPDLIVLDILMPVMDGMGLLRHVHGQPEYKDLPILILSDLGDRQSIIEAGRFGICHYMLKADFSVTKLLTRVEQCIGGCTPGKAPDAGAADVDEPSAGPVVEASHAESPSAEVPAAVNPDATAVEALKTIKPILTRSQIDEHVVHCGELKALSPTVARLLKMTGSPNCSIDQVSQLVKQDQALALKILKLANSVGYTRGEPVESVQTAVMRIGLSQIRQVAMNIAVIDRFSLNASAGQLDSVMFWEHSIATALISAALARCRGAGEADIESAFTTGLLHDVGRMVFTEQFPDLYARVLETAAELRLPLEQVESRMLLVNHADLMDKVLHQWKFSKHLTDAIALHHLSLANARNLGRSSVTEVATLALANRLAHAMLLGSSGNEAIYPTEDFVKALSLNEQHIAQIEAEIPDQTRDLKFAMVRTDGTEAWPDMQQQLRGRLHAPIQPVFAGAEPGIDGYRIFTQRLRSAGSDQPPNLAVVHIGEVRERGAVTTALREAEQAAQVSKLPALIISPNGNLALESGAMQNRQVKFLNSPSALARVIDVINSMELAVLAGDEGMQHAA